MQKWKRELGKFRGVDLRIRWRVGFYRVLIYCSDHFVEGDIRAGDD